MTFQPGIAANPNGRPKGSRNRRTQEILDLIQGRGDKDPLDALSEIVTTNKDPNIVATAANMLAPYVHSKRGTLSAPRFLPDTVEVPAFRSITEAEDYLASIPVLLGKGEIDSQTALELSTLTKNWLDAIYAHQEYDLKLQAQGGGSDQTIRIEGGLPPLPGTNVIMSKTAIGTNGHNGHPAIDHKPTVNDSLNGQVVSSALAQSDEPPANPLETRANAPSDT
jgi:hypothetical protein